MHSTSSLYNTIRSGNHTDRVVLEIETVTNGTTEYVELDETKLYSLKTSFSMFPEEKPSIGNFCAREIDVVFEPPVGKDIPKQARMRIFTYLYNGTQQSERIPKGVFFIDTREYNADKTKMLVHGYDAAIKFDSDINSTDFEWPYSALNLVVALANSVGVSVDRSVTDAITNFNSGFKVPLTICTKREMIQFIAAMCGGNCYIGDDGKLHLMYLRVEPNSIEYGYLSDENGNNITIGGDRIIVERNY